MGTGAGNCVGGPANVGAPQGANAAVPHATSGGTCPTALFAACAAPTGKPSRGMRRRLVRGLRRSCMGTGAGNGVSGPANVGAPQGANAAAPHATSGGTCVTALFAACAAPTGKPSRGMRRRRLVRGLRRSYMGTGAGNGVGGPANVGAPQGANAAAPDATVAGVGASKFENWRLPTYRAPPPSAQFSSRKPSTRSNSRRLFVTKTRPSLRAWPAIWRSFTPIGLPLRSRSARMSP
jgi:hypothetical protein